ncbi:MAG: pitrilysin family protein, partial [bacterium]|nr:pitrilysin family protein [bacterium]
MDTYKKTILVNGLRVITVPMPAVDSVTAMILVGAGSRYETKRTNGISHFLEHMTFKGTPKRPSAFAISSTIDGIGADFNASTGKEETLFYVKSAKEHLDLALDVISDMVLAPLIKKDEVEREKGVILEELNMYEDLPMRRAAEYFEQLLFPNSSLGWDIGGEKETVKGITREDFLEYRQRLYLPDNMVLVVAGGAAEEEVVEMAQKYLGGLNGKKGRSEFGETFKQEKPQIFLKTKKTDQTHLVLGVRGNPLGHKDRYAETILASILGGGLSSRLFIQMRDKRGLAYYVRADAEHFLDNGYFAAAAGVDTQRVDEAILAILEEFRKLTNASAIESQELTKAKEYVKGRLILELEDSRSV